MTMMHHDDDDDDDDDGDQTTLACLLLRLDRERGWVRQGGRVGKMRMRARKAQPLHMLQLQHKCIPLFLT